MLKAKPLKEEIIILEDILRPNKFERLLFRTE